MDDITDRQKEILTFIQRTTEERGLSADHPGDR